VTEAKIFELFAQQAEYQKQQMSEVNKVLQKKQKE